MRCMNKFLEVANVQPDIVVRRMLDKAHAATQERTKVIKAIDTALKTNFRSLNKRETAKLLLANLKRLPAVKQYEIVKKFLWYADGVERVKNLSIRMLVKCAWALVYFILVSLTLIISTATIGAAAGVLFYLITKLASASILIALGTGFVTTVKAIHLSMKWRGLIDTDPTNTETHHLNVRDLQKLVGPDNKNEVLQDVANVTAQALTSPKVVNHFKRWRRADLAAKRARKPKKKVVQIKRDEDDEYMQAALAHARLKIYELL